MRTLIIASVLALSCTSAFAQARRDYQADRYYSNYDLRDFRSTRTTRTSCATETTGGVIRTRCTTTSN